MSLFDGDDHKPFSEKEPPPGPCACRLKGGTISYADGVIRCLACGGIRSGVEQQVARGPHKTEVAGSSPAPATRTIE